MIPCQYMDLLDHECHRNWNEGAVMLTTRYAPHTAGPKDSETSYRTVLEVPGTSLLTFRALSGDWPPIRPLMWQMIKQAQFAPALLFVLLAWGGCASERPPRSMETEPIESTLKVIPADHQDADADPEEQTFAERAAEIAGESSRPQRGEPELHIKLLAELDRFRKTDSFARYGFATGGPHHQWLERVQAARQRSDLDFNTRVSLGELATLGQEYRKSKGAENGNTRWFRRRVLDPLGDD